MSHFFGIFHQYLTCLVIRFDPKFVKRDFFPRFSNSVHTSKKIFNHLKLPLLIRVKLSTKEKESCETFSSIEITRQSFNAAITFHCILFGSVRNRETAYN